MSYSPNTLPHSGYASPYSIPVPPVALTPSSALSSKPGSSRSTPKPTNVFTNDGSFLERIQRSKKLEGDKKKDQELLEKKKNFDNRFKNRGKRPAPSPVPSSDTTSSADDHPPAKKPKSTLEPQAHAQRNDYQSQVRTYANRVVMKDAGTGIRLLKWNLDFADIVKIISPVIHSPFTVIPVFGTVVAV